MAVRAQKPVPDGVSTITPSLWFNGNCQKAVDFYQKALGAQLIGDVMTGPNGEGVMHAYLQLGDSKFMMADAWPGSWEQGPNGQTTQTLWLYVEDCDALFNQAVEAGCEVLEPMMDAFWGDRTGKMKDPFGHCWAIASHVWILTPEEMQSRQEEWLKTMQP